MHSARSTNWVCPRLPRRVPGLADVWQRPPTPWTPTAPHSRLDGIGPLALRNLLRRFLLVPTPTMVGAPGVIWTLPPHCAICTRICTRRPMRKSSICLWARPLNLDTPPCVEDPSLASDALISDTSDRVRLNKLTHLLVPSRGALKTNQLFSDSQRSIRNSEGSGKKESQMTNRAEDIA